MKAQGREQGTAPALLRMMDETTARGTYTSADVCPYAWRARVASRRCWCRAGPWTARRDAMLRRASPTPRNARASSRTRKRPCRRRIPAAHRVATGHGKELVDAMREFGITSPGEALVRLLEQQDGGAILRFGVEEDLIAILKHPNASVACDCGAVPGRATHPRYYGTFPRVLGRYVREQQVLTWEDAVRKMSALPAATMGLVTRGYLAPGMAADVVVFDPATIIDHATFEEPTAASDGVRHVVVNGAVVYRDGVPTGERAGQVLLRGPHEPSRPMSTAVARRVSGRTQATELEANINVQQGQGQRSPRGRLRLLDRTSKTAVEMTEIGLLQVAPGWAAVTGVGRIGDEERAFTVVVEQADPLDERQSTTVTVLGEDGYQLTRIVMKNAVRVSPR
ncbi:MAG: amidohydrolase family protein [Vicinamibacterales bacterium]